MCARLQGESPFSKIKKFIFNQFVRQGSIMCKKSYVSKLDAQKYLDLILYRISTEVLIEQNWCFLMAVKAERKLSQKN